MGAVSNSFMEDVLARIRAPITPVNVENLQTWRSYEGGTALWNPLNTEQPMPFSHDYNSAGVQDYATAASGIAATSQTLQNGRYTAILVKLRASAPLSLWNDSSVLEQIDTWGTHGFAAHIRGLAPAPTPSPKEEIVVSCFVPGIGDWVLFENAGRYVHVTSSEDVAALIAAGARQVTITPAQHQAFLAAFPNPGGQP